MLKVYFRMFGYTGIPDWKNKMTLNGRLHNLKMPVFALGADDDIIFMKEMLPRDEIREDKV